MSAASEELRLDGPEPGNACELCGDTDRHAVMHPEQVLLCRGCAAPMLDVQRILRRPKRLWLDRAREAGERLYHQHSRRNADELLTHELIELVYQDWLDSLEYARPSAFAECTRAAKFMRDAFESAFRDEMYVCTTN